MSDEGKGQAIKFVRSAVPIAVLGKFGIRNREFRPTLVRLPQIGPTPADF